MTTTESQDPTAVTATLTKRFPECLRFLESLVTVNSFTGNAAGVNANADLIASQFAPLGFSARRIPCEDADAGDHLVLDSGGSAPAIACISHLDTVFPEEEEALHQFRWQREGDLVYGPGTYDIKGGTALMWLMFAAMKEALPGLFDRFRWLLLWNAAEERLVPDFSEVCFSVMPETTKACLVFEGDNEPREGFTLIHSRKGMAKFHIQVEGRGGHAGNSHHKGANAVHQLAKLVCRAEALTDHDRDLTVNVGPFHGGVVPNRIPEKAEAWLEMRAYSPELFDQTRAALLGFGGAGDVCARSDGHACRVTVTETPGMPPWQANDAAMELVERWKAAGRESGIEVDATRRGGVSDANPLAAKFPTLDGLGPRGGNPHVSAGSKDGTDRPEFVDLSSLVPKAVMNLRALEAFR